MAGITSLRMLRRALATLLTFALVPFIAVAHPLDISSSFFTVRGETVTVSTFFHPFEIEYLLADALGDTRRFDLQQYFTHADTITAYVRDHIVATSGEQRCTFVAGDIPRKLDYEMLAGGLEVRYTFACPTTVKDFALDTQFFIVDFPLQTNRITLYNTAARDQTTAAVKKILTAKFTTFEWRQGVTVAAIKDRDSDGLADEEELSYRTNPDVVDTDGDGYSDGEEVFSGWDPVKATPSPGQQPANNDEGDGGHIFGAMVRHFFDGGSGGGDPSDVFSTGPLKSVLAHLTSFFAAPTMAGAAVVFAAVYLLGLFHAASVGHGKTMLASYLVDGKKTIPQGVVFALILTLTHLADVVLLGLVFKIFSGFRLAAAWMSYLQIIAVVGLVVLSGYVLFRAVRGLRARRADATSSNERPSLAMAFLLGLAPCTFGWAIFLVLLSLGQTAWVLPLLAAFGLGIFSCLLIVVGVVGVLQTAATRRFAWVATYAPIVSGALLFIFSLRIAWQFATGVLIA